MSVREDVMMILSLRKDRLADVVRRQLRKCWHRSHRNKPLKFERRVWFAVGENREQEERGLTNSSDRQSLTLRIATPSSLASA